MGHETHSSGTRYLHHYHYCRPYPCYIPDRWTVTAIAGSHIAGSHIAGLYVYQVFAVIILFGVFRAGFAHGWLRTMPGPLWIEHGHLIFLLLIPAFHWTVYILWGFGMYAYIDDFRQHWKRAHGHPNFTSWLHITGWWYIVRHIIQE